MLIGFFLGLLAGIAVQLQQAELWDGLSYMACMSMALLGLMGQGVWRYHRSQMSTLNTLFLRALICLLAAFLSFGLTGWRSVQYLQHALNADLEGVDMEVVGVIAAMPHRLDTGLRFRLDVEAAHWSGAPVTLPPRLLLSMYDMDPSRSPKAGERWQFLVRLKAPHGNSNPHGFDYELWLWEQGAGASGYVRDNPRQMPPRLLGQVRWSPLLGIERARQAVRDQVFQQLAHASERASAGVLAALITGDQNAIERSDWDIFRTTGVAHLMSISGLHITMFAWLAALLLGKLWRCSVRFTPRLCLALSATHAGLLGGLLLASLYAWFSGWGVPAQRTIWMLATMTLLRLSGLRWPWYATWLLAAVVVLMVDPWAMLSAGFWLSFVAVAVLFASDTPPARPELVEGQDANFDRLSPNGLRRVWLVLREQWLITLALAPLTLLLFQQVSLVSLLANALAIPVVTCVVTPLAMLGVAFHPLWDVASVCIGWLGLALKWLASLPYAVYTAPAAPLGLSALAVLGGVLLVLPLAVKQRLVAIGCAAGMILPAMLWQPSRPAQGQFELLAIDIGQGNAILIRTAAHSLLFDAGPRFSRESDAGHRTIVPLLRSLGEKLDVLMLSHRDSDHTGGAKAVLAMQPQAQVVTSITRPAELAALGLPETSQPCFAGQSWLWDGVRFDVLHPAQGDLDADQSLKPNATACVLKITNADATNPKSALLTADIETPQEQMLIDLQADALPSTVLLVPHHGSKTSSSDAFLDAVKPKMALVQAGYRNRFQHPRPEVMARYDERHIPTFLSPNCGAMTWASDAPEKVICQRDVRRRYWMHH
ncbi:MAG: DNA internalization-related competence protein ComEC/Rec2 [Cytophagales bacterium]|nr:DNA internalization-related competence protein ComEC/Rec2 [Cytophagales bacterium]